MRSITESRVLRRLALYAVVLLGLLLAGGAAYCRYLGYPGGPIFTSVAASAPPDAENRGTVAVFLSGDMGFNTGMGPQIAARIAAQGIPVIGVNSLTAFAHRRTPDQTAALVRGATARALAMPGARRVVLIGQSFGAGSLLVGIDQLPPGMRARVAMVALLVPPPTVAFQTLPGGVIDLGGERPALPAAKRLGWTPVLCIHGDRETDSLCPTWTQRNVIGVALPGDHFLHRDSALVATTILRTLALVA